MNEQIIAKKEDHYPHKKKEKIDKQKDRKRTRM